MGQEQSAGVHEDSVSDFIDYYKLLGLQQDASENEIKKAYREKALELHPDRNFGNVEASTKLFAEIQCAYEILADPHERARYDSHRDAILFGNGTIVRDQFCYNTRMTSTDDILKLFPKFGRPMELSDSTAGFFGGLRAAFDQLAQEEKLACEWDDLGSFDYPSFGGRDDDFDSVVYPFYTTWSNFATRKSFAWRDAYRFNEAPDRRARRLMEKENKRLRAEGIREYNDVIRSFVTFIRKRDPRYRANAQNEAERQKALRQSAATQAAKSRAANQAKLREHVVPQWARTEEPKDEVNANSESEMEQFECVACRKFFKSEKQLQAHEQSRKHLKSIKRLCREMRAEDKELDHPPETNNKNQNVLSSEEQPT